MSNGFLRIDAGVTDRIESEQNRFDSLYTR